MNAVTKAEAHAIETAVPLEAADPTKNLILVPLSQLLPRRSKRNVRTTPRQSIPELAASIARVGLLQNLIVTGWMPAVFQTEHHTEPEAADEAAALEDAAAEVEVHALAA